MVFKNFDRFDAALLNFQIVSPFLAYRGLLLSYQKFIIDSSYKAKNFNGHLLREEHRKNLSRRLNRVGIPLLFLTYIALNELNKNRNKQLLYDIRDTLLSNSDSNSNSNQSSFLPLPLTKKFIKNKWLIYLKPLGILIILKIISSY